MWKCGWITWVSGLVEGAVEGVVEDVVGYLVVGTPGDELHPLGDEYGGC